ncbi:MAG: NAD-dependent succinate-semialdehyde dehydrogenase [Actinobacteria bacterium]|nr:NAD-dependent succinate-semialdehyde dehydrogenase [Actinomycetota bacterium]
MALKSDLFIGGNWIVGQERIPVTDPSDESTIAEISLAGEKEVEMAVSAAYKAQKSWAKTAPRVRSEILRKAFELMVQEADAIATIVVKENGKIFTDARNEVIYAAEFFRWFAEEAVRINGEFRHSPSGDKRFLVTQQPIGVSLLITPWNFPAAMATRKIGPALAAGCTTILKPATETPLTALAVVDILQRAGVPDGVVNVILPKQTGKAVSSMLHDSRVMNLSFTGSTEVGRVLLKESADRIVRTSMELGGNAPVVIFDDADLDVAVQGTLVAKMRNGGAACTAANRIYVSKKIAKNFTEKLTEAMAKIKMAPGLSEGAQLGAFVSMKERNKIAELVDTAVKNGADVKTGGKIVTDKGAFYPPTVLEVDAKNEILKHEVFGPVAPIVTFDDDEEAIKMANDTEFGLISYVFSSDLGRAIRAAEAIESGMVAINRGVISDPAAPFGGVKQSGIGREGGFDGINEFLEKKYIGVEI